MKSYNWVTILIVALVFFGGCKSDQNSGSQDNETQIEFEESDGQTEISAGTTFRIPSPVEYFEFIYKTDAPFVADVLSDPGAVERYNTNLSKALNLGVYASDLVYSSVYRRPQEVALYFRTTRQLADQLSLMAGFDDKTTKRLEANMNNPDSIYQISNDAYWALTNTLESDNQLKTMNLIMAGGWLESCYIASESISEFSADNKLVIRLAEQQLLLDNILLNFEKMKDTESPNEFLDSLYDLQETYNQLYYNEEEIITAAQYQEIVNKFTKLRSYVVSMK